MPPSKIYADSPSSSRGSSRDGAYYYDSRDTRPVPYQPSKQTSSKKEKPIIVDKRDKIYDEPHRRDQYSSKYR